MTEETNQGEAAQGPADLAFAARCVLRAAKSATLATQSGGQPFASLVTHATAPDGCILLLLSGLSAHTRHLQAEPRCALLVAGPPAGANPQTAPRLTVVATARPEPDPALRRFWVDRHPYAALYADFADFGLWRLVPRSGHYVGGFAVARTLQADALAPRAQALLAASEAAALVAGCNESHAAALARLARPLAAGGAWRMLGVDPDGIDLVQDETVLRVAFDRPANDADGVRSAVARLVQAALPV